MCVLSWYLYALCVCSILLGVVIGLREGDCDLLDELVDAAGALVGEHGVEGLGLALARAVLEVQALGGRLRWYLIFFIDLLLGGTQLRSDFKILAARF